MVMGLKIVAIKIHWGGRGVYPAMTEYKLTGGVAVFVWCRAETSDFKISKFKERILSLINEVATKRLPVTDLMSITECGICNAIPVVVEFFKQLAEQNDCFFEIMDNAFIRISLKKSFG